MEPDSIHQENCPNSKDATSAVDATGTPHSRGSLKHRLFRCFREFFICSLQALVLTLIIINFIGRVSVVQGSSMGPSLHSNTRILVNLVAYRFHKPSRGEIVIFQCPINPSRDYIKRVIAVEGDELSILEGVVYLNGLELAEPYVDSPDRLDNLNPTVIPPGYVFVMGDNRCNSEDSRLWGPLDCSLIKGKAQVIFWPARSFQVLR